MFIEQISDAHRNSYTCAKPSRPIMNLSSVTWGHVNVPSPHGLRYCMLVIDHRTSFTWARFFKIKDDICAELEAIMLEICHMYAWFHSAYDAFAPLLNFDSDSVFMACTTRLMCSRLGVGVYFFAPYARYMLGKAECPWRTRRNNALAMMSIMSVLHVILRGLHGSLPTQAHIQSYD
jgi:hypothetical protein